MSDRFSKVLSAYGEDLPSTEVPSSSFNVKPGADVQRLSPKARELMSNIQKFTGITPTTTSGYRTKHANKAAGGVDTSKHLTGEAFDLRIRDLSGEQRQDILGYLNSVPGVTAFIHKGNHIHAELHGDVGVDKVAPVKPAGRAAKVIDAYGANVPTEEKISAGSALENMLAARPLNEVDVTQNPEALVGEVDATNTEFGINPPSTDPTYRDRYTRVIEGLEQTGPSLRRRLGLNPPQGEEPSALQKIGRIPVDLGPGALGGILGILDEYNPLSPKTQGEFLEDPVGALKERTLTTPKELVYDPADRTTRFLYDLMVGGNLDAIKGNPPSGLKRLIDDPSQTLGDLMMVLGMARGLGSGIGEVGALRKGKRAKVVSPAETPVETGKVIKGTDADYLDAILKGEELSKEPPKVIKGKDITERATERIPVEEPPQPKVIKGSDFDALEARVAKDNLESRSSKVIKSYEQPTEIIRPKDTPTEVIRPKDTQTEVIRQPKPDDATVKIDLEKTVRGKESALEVGKAPEPSGSVIPTTVRELMDEGFSRAEAVDIIREQRKAGGILDTSKPKSRPKPPKEERLTGIPEDFLETEPGTARRTKREATEVTPTDTAKRAGFKDVDDFAKKQGFDNFDHMVKEMGVKPKTKSPKGDSGVYLGSGLGGGQGVLPKTKPSNVPKFYGEELPSVLERSTKKSKTGVDVKEFDPSPELKEYAQKNMKDISVRESGDFTTLDPARAAEQIEGRPQGVVHREIVERADKIENRIDKLEKNVYDKFKDIGKSRRYSKALQRYGEHLTAPDGSPSKLSPKQVAKLEKKYGKERLQKDVNRVRRFYDQFHKKLTDAGVKIKYRKDYFAQLREAVRAARAFGEDSVAPGKAEPGFGFMKRRSNWEKRTTGAFQGIQAYARSGGRLLYATPELPRMRAVTNVLPANARKYFETFLDEGVAGKPNPAMAEFAASFPKTKKAMDFAKRLYVNNIVLGNLGIALNQLAGVVQTVAAAGVKNTLKAAGKVMNLKRRAVWKKYSSELFKRAKDTEYRPDVMGSAKKFASYLMDVLDQVDIQMSLEALYQKAIDSGMSSKNALKYADEITKRTHASYLKTRKSPIQRHPIGQYGAVLQNFTINLYNYLKRDLPRMAKYDPKSKAMGQIIRFAASAYLVNQAFDHAFGRKPYEISSFIPFYGSVKYGPGVASKVKDIILAIAETSFGDDRRDISDAQYKGARAASDFVIPAQLRKTGQAALINMRDKGKVGKGRNKKFQIKGAKDKARSYAFGIYGTKAAKGYFDERDSNKPTLKERVKKGADKARQVIDPNYRPKKAPRKRKRRK